ncbi:hypothetical protein TcWFU_000405 [Taenia crassiceps]|uniref:Uncharacterized protein n=1 Tax=Taenia crassiceps TaxID=6207 RepID=A0ABR4QNJ7_9CEST
MEGCMDGGIQQFKCCYAISGRTIRQTSISRKRLDHVYKLYQGEDELFYFPLAELPTTVKSGSFSDRALSIDPWPAYATERMNTDTQILRDGNRLIAQSKEQSTVSRNL